MLNCCVWLRNGRKIILFLMMVVVTARMRTLLILRPTRRYQRYSTEEAIYQRVGRYELHRSWQSPSTTASLRRLQHAVTQQRDPCYVLSTNLEQLTCGLPCSYRSGEPMA
mmetsp:Transcript_56656/g.132962  ORF Transcript_56656/g.132962 Transcript_56656/m.132962 type:complete len:110 (+) Transcript_56656:578-907(+)